MAHEIESMFYVGQEPWHGLGTKVLEAPTAQEAIILAKLDWNVELCDMFIKSEYNEPILVPDKVAVVRDSDKSILGTVGKRYTPFQPNECFSIADAIVEQQEGAHYNTAGSLMKGKKIWMLVELSQTPMQITKKDEVAKYLLLSNSYDGSSSLQIMLTPIRVVCWNTLSAAVSGADSIVSIRHTHSMHQRVEDAKKTLGLAAKYFTDFEAQSKYLASKQVTDKLLNTYFFTLFPDEDENGQVVFATTPEEKEKVKHNRIQQRAELRTIHDSSPSIVDVGARGTLWGAYNAVTQWTDHYQGTRGSNNVSESRLHRQWFGVSRTLKQEAWDKALQFADLKVA